MAEIRVNTSDKHEPRGWAFPANAKKAHYFINGCSLCGRWTHYFGVVDPIDRSTHLNCRQCSVRRWWLPRR